MNRAAIFLLFFLSGVVGLVYEIAWLRQFRFIMGNTVYTTATVLTAFMGGLALGSFLCGRIVDRLRRPLRAYGVIEILVGFYAAAVPLLMWPADPLYGWLYRHWGDAPALLSIGRFVISSAILLLPTTLMGATLPLLSRSLTQELAWVGRDVGRLYGLNTIGAATGAALAGFVLIPQLGTSWTVGVGVAGSFVVGLASLWLDRGMQPTSRPSMTEVIAADPEADDGTRRLVLIGIGCAGFASMIYEVAWTRTLALLLGSSVYAFTLMLVAFITGLGVGGLIMSTVVDRRREPMLWLGGLQLVVALAALLVVPLFGVLPLVVVDLVTRYAGSFGTLHGVEFAVVLALMLVPTLAMGAVFPVVARLYARDLSHLGRSVGEAYAANTLGAVLGSFTAGFLLLPFTGPQTAILLATAINAALGGVFLLRAGGATATVRRTVVAVVGLAVALLIWRLPTWDAGLLNSAPYLYAPKYQAGRSSGADLSDVMTRNRRLVWEKEGLSATVTVVESGGELYLKVNGKSAASSHEDLRTHSLLSHLPLLLHPDPQRALMIGIGSGVTLGAAERHPLRHIEAVELLPEVVEAASLFSHVNGDAFADPRAQIFVADGRNHLAHTQGRFDVIVSQPSNLWIAGMADLFTVEFFEQTRSRLEPGGIMCTWIQAYAMRSQDFATLVRGFRRVYPHAQLWESLPGGDYFLVGAEQPIELSLQTLQQRARERGVDADLHRIGVPGLDQVLHSFALDTEGLDSFAGDGPLNTDDNAHLEFHSPRGLYQEISGQSGIFVPAHLDAHRPDGPAAVLSDEAVADSLVQGWEARRLTRLALARMRHGDYAQARTLLERAASQWPNDIEVARLYPELALKVGGRLEGTGQLQAAEHLYEHVHQIVPGDVRLLLRLARVYEQSRRPDNALAAAERAVDVRPDYLPARRALGATLIRQQQFEQAVRLYEETLEMHPRHPAVLGDWGRLRLLQGDVDRAIALLGMAVAEDEQNPQLFSDYGIALSRSGQHDEAERQLRRAIALRPEDPRSYVNLGDALRAAGDVDGARSAFEKALRRAPGFPPAVQAMQSLP